MKDVKKNKLLLKILSTVIAIILWTAITYTEDPVITQTITGIDVSLLGEETLNDNGFAIVNRKELPAVSVVIRGKRNSVIDALDKIYATADVSAIKSAGQSEISISYSYPKDKVTIEKIKTNKVPVETEKLISSEIPVKIEVRNREKNDNHIIKSVSETKHITVSGAENTIYKISYARVEIDVSKVSKTSTQNCIYELCSEDGETVPEDNIVKKSSPTIAVKNTVYTKTSLPIKVVIDEEYQDDYDFELKDIEKKTVNVGLDEGANIDHINAVLIPKKNETEYEAKLEIPEGVYLPEEERTVSVTAEILKKTVKEILVTVTPVNEPEETVVMVLPRRRTIKIRTAKDIDDIKVTATVDVSEMRTDEEELPLKIKADDGVEVLGSYTVTVKLKAGE